MSFRIDLVISSGLTLLCLFPSAAGANALDNWHVSGENTLRGSIYEAHGDTASSPYPSVGNMYYNELNLYFDWKDSAYSTWRGEIAGVYNANDDYRATDFGVTPERLNLTREDGNAAIPYRAEGGDFFTYFSNMTVQNSVKGAQIELQPAIEGAEYRYSLIAFTGSNQSNWRGLQLPQDYSTGVSLLMSNPGHGSYSVNLVRNSRSGDTGAGTLERDQYVISAAAEKPFRYAGQNLIAEGEIALFNGDHDGVAGAASGQSREETGYFLQLSGSSDNQPWDYQLRIQRYGQDFRPRGAIVTADRKSIEGFFNWRFDSGITLRLRSQRFDDAFETTNRLRTQTNGVNLTGALFHRLLPDMSGNVDLYHQTSADNLKLTDRNSTTLSASFSKPLPFDWNGKLSLFAQNTNDRTATNADANTRQITLSGDHAIRVFGFDGYLTPGVLYRNLGKGVSDSLDWNPTLAASLSNGKHSLRMDFNGLFQTRRIGVSGPDIRTRTFRLDYRMQEKQHTFGLETELFARDQLTSGPTDAYRVSLYWTYQFDKPAVHSTTGVSRATTAYGPGAAQPGLTAGLTGLYPGIARDRIESALQDANVVNGVQQGDYTVYELALLKTIARRQRLAVKYQAGVLQRAALIIDFNDVGDGNSSAQIFQKIRQRLIKELGNPTRTFEEGTFDADFARAVNEQRFIRLAEWQTRQGIIRFGIPRRLDGQVRMEIQHAMTFSQPRQTLWSIDSVR